MVFDLEELGAVLGRCVSQFRAFLCISRTPVLPRGGGALVSDWVRLEPREASPGKTPGCQRLVNV